MESSIVASTSTDSLLGAFNRAGVLAPADVHVARRLARLGGDSDDLVALGCAFAVRAPRLGHVRVDLRSVRLSAEVDETLEDDTTLDGLQWPDPAEWAARVAASPLVAVGDADPTVAPLRLVGSALYLDRYWRDECDIAADLLARATVRDEPPGLEQLLGRLYIPGSDDDQRRAASCAATSGLAVIAGGPGTGKTTTVARAIALLAEQALAAGAAIPLVALAAPTGKAANRMQEAVRSAARDLDVSPEVANLLLGIEASTVHRLLHRRRDNSSRFRYDRHNRLPHDVVVVDEASMLSLWLMARLVESVRNDARFILVGDPEQLASVEAGAVLGDIAGRASNGAATGRPGISRAVVVLRTNHRFRGAVARLAEVIRRGDADAAVAVLRDAGDDSVRWVEVDVSAAERSATAGSGSETEAASLAPLRHLVCEAGREVLAAASAGDDERALEALHGFRLLCAHRRGRAGVAYWNLRVEQWLAEEVEGFSGGSEWYVGRPVIVVANDYSMQLFNGDTGVTVAREQGGVSVAFERGPVSPSRLSRVETLYAMTVHKAQGSEFDRVAVVLAPPTSRVLTRELLYTAVSRAKQQLLLIGSEESVRAAVTRPIARASGLTERLWGAE